MSTHDSTKDLQDLNLFCVLNDELDSDLCSDNHVDISNDVIYENNVDNMYHNQRDNNNKSLHKRRHRRSKGKRSKVIASEHNLRVAFNNVNRVKPKIYELTRFLIENNINIMGVAETFLEHEQCININGYKWVGKNRLKKGGGGGVGFLVSDDICITDDDLCNSQSDSYERLWIKVKIGNKDIHLAVAYFPVQGTNPDLVNELYNQILGEVIQIEQTNDGVDPHILIMGDFNGRIGDKIYGGDPVRNSNGECLLDFVKHAHLEIINCNRKCKGKITWFRHPHSSTIDYFLSSYITESHIIDMVIDEERLLNLGSDHNMLITNLKFKSVRNRSNDHEESIDQASCHWNISKDQNWSSYQSALEEAFSDWDPTGFQDIDLLWDNWKNKLIHVTSEVIGFKNKNDKIMKQWWCKTTDGAIKERKQASRDHRMWSKHERDNKEKGDQLWEDYKFKKHKVKTLIQQKMTKKRCERSLKIASMGGVSSKDFWKNLRGTKRRDNLLSLKLPNSDKIITDRSVMKQNIMLYWNTLGNMDMAMNDNFNHVEKLIDKIKHGKTNVGFNTDVLLNDIVISFEVVKDAIANSKNNKSPGLDMITNELLKNGGNGIVTSLKKFFNQLLHLGNTPLEWNKGIIVPIFKKGNKNDLNNYRGITLTSCVSKIFNRIVANSISNFVENNNILSEVQGGFRKNHRCEDHVFTLKSIAATRLAENKQTYMAFLDFRKAFDTVWRNRLLTVAWNLGIRGRVWNILNSLYQNVQCNVKMGDIVTDFFDIEEGVKQGCVLSPILFCLYINELSKMLNEHDVGIHIMVLTLNVFSG